MDTINKILQMLGISLQRYNELMFMTGEEYFAHKCIGYNAILQSFRQSSIMWAWWKNQYHVIDEAIANDYTVSGYKIKEDMYRAIHLGLDYYPDESIVKKVLDEYSKAIRNEVKESQIHLIQ